MNQRHTSDSALEPTIGALHQLSPQSQETIISLVGLFASPPHTMPHTNRARDIPRNATTRIGTRLTANEYRAPHDAAVRNSPIRRSTQARIGVFQLKVPIRPEIIPYVVKVLFFVNTY